MHVKMKARKIMKVLKARRDMKASKARKKNEGT